MRGLCGLSSVFLHYVVVHDGWSPEQRNTRENTTHTLTRAPSPSASSVPGRTQTLYQTSDLEIKNVKCNAQIYDKDCFTWSDSEKYSHENSGFSFWNYCLIFQREEKTDVRRLHHEKWEFLPLKCWETPFMPHITLSQMEGQGLMNRLILDLPWPIGCILPQAAPILSSFFIRSTNN